MAIGKEIRKQIKSIQNTQKITRAMEMVAASKMRRAQERMQAARPYAHKIRQVINHLHYAHPEYKHPFVLTREARRVGFIVVTSDRGLCGGLNTNLLRTALVEMKAWHDKKADIDLCTIGTKGFMFGKRLGLNIFSDFILLAMEIRAELISFPVIISLPKFRISSSRGENSFLELNNNALSTVIPARRLDAINSMKSGNTSSIFLSL
jgi:F-type H+-transporting ATPase subunit gamma